MDKSLQLYNALFEVKPATTAEDIEAVYALRHQVYCIERGYEEAQAGVTIEKDAYDSRAVYSLLIYKPTGAVLGTARVVMPNEDNVTESYPMQGVCEHPMLSDDEMVMAHPELSRFAISRDRREKVLADKTFLNTLEKLDMDKDEAIRSVFANMCVGLIGSTVNTVVKMGFTGVFAILEPSLLRLLGRLGVSGKKLGEVVEYHGKRQPCVFDKDFFDMDAENVNPLMKQILEDNHVNDVLDVTHSFV